MRQALEGADGHEPGEAPTLEGIILSQVIGRRWTLTAEMRDLADFMRLPL